MDRGRRNSRVNHHHIGRLLQNPIAVRVLEIATGSAGGYRTSANGIKKELCGHFPGVEVRQVAYHLSRLQDAELLPRRMPEI